MHTPHFTRTVKARPDLCSREVLVPPSAACGVTIKARSQPTGFCAATLRTAMHEVQHEIAGRTNPAGVQGSRINLSANSVLKALGVDD